MAILLRTTLPYTTGLPRDVVSHSFAISGGEPTVGDAIGILTDQFYNGLYGTQVNPISDYLSPCVSRATDACTIDVYDLDLATGETGAPIFTGAFTLASTSAVGVLPMECAICISYEAGPGVASSPGAGRGRMFMGPLVAGTLDVSGVFPIVAPAVADDLAQAALGLGTEWATVGVTWGIWSRKDHLYHTIVRGWVDNEFDTLRSRAVEATSRSVWTLPAGV